jgi:superfamily II DNA/RNA helicase
VEGIEQVINYELPESPQLFTHRVGWTGRMGRQGQAITFILPRKPWQNRSTPKYLDRGSSLVSSPGKANNNRGEISRQRTTVLHGQ